jgi:hypothetical protein
MPIFNEFLPIFKIRFFKIQNRCLWKIRRQAQLELMMLTYKLIATERIFKLQETCLSLRNFYP